MESVFNKQWIYADNILFLHIYSHVVGQTHSPMFFATNFQNDYMMSQNILMIYHSHIVYGE